MKELFAELQPRSFAKQREYCGFLGATPKGACAPPSLCRAIGFLPMTWPGTWR
jgi:hypothetical protein